MPGSGARAPVRAQAERVRVGALRKCWHVPPAPARVGAGAARGRAWCPQSSARARCASSQLPGVEACESYAFRYGRNPLMELPLAVNPTGCARAEPKMSAHVKRFVLRYFVFTSHSTAQGS